MSDFWPSCPTRLVSLMGVPSGAGPQRAHPSLVLSSTWLSLAITLTSGWRPPGPDVSGAPASAVLPFFVGGRPDEADHVHEAVLDRGKHEPDNQRLKWDPNPGMQADSF